ncbi:hypothetical protein LZ30DRAFT_817821 [Colletotrichum cereale]|nr:hypothetical protein LZ30DRAFT_817821 [Colletotrichum cereale]
MASSRKDDDATHLLAAGGLNTTSPLRMPQRAREYAESEWNQMQPHIQHLYIGEKCSLKEVVRLLSERHCFHVNEKMCKGRLKKWKIHKYNTEERVKEFLSQAQDGSSRRSQAKSRKVDKYLRRKKMTAGALLASHQERLNDQHQAHVDESVDPEVNDKVADITEDTPSLEVIANDPPHHEQYEEDCPYGQFDKWFRLKENLPDGAQYQGDSSGDGSWINEYSDKPCTLRCLCHHHEVASAAVFLVEKAHESIFITFYSKPLLSLVQSTVRELGVNSGISSSVDGLILLQHHAAMQGCLTELHYLHELQPKYNTLLCELKLLVNGVLCNGEVFKSFGYDKLKERGFIDETLLKTLSRQSLDASAQGLSEALQEFTLDPLEERNVFKHTKIDSRDEISSHFQRWPAMWILCEGGEPSFDLESLDCLLKEPLSIATAEGNAIMIKYHLESGCNPDMLLLYAATTNDTTTLGLLLDQGADASDALVAATRFGFQGVVEVLLQHGVDVNCITENGSPLSVAAKHWHRSLAMSLVQRGADVHMAIKCLRLGGLSTDDHSSAEDMLRKLPKTLPTTRPTPAQRAVNLSARGDMRYLRNRLVSAFPAVKQKASISTSTFRKVGQKLSRYRSSWSLGVKTLRMLINGRAPEGLTEAIAFLCLARAMVDTLKARHHRDFLQDFMQDLPRWQVIFNPADVIAYREALLLMWGVDLDIYDSPCHADPGGFQRLVSILANNIDDRLGALPSKSLLGPQRVWMQQEECVGYPLEIANPPPQANIMTEPQPQWDPSPLDPWGEIGEHDRTRYMRIVECLTIGVAFALVILFAEILQKLLRTDCCTRVSLPSLATAESRRRLLHECSGFTGRSHGVVRVMGIFGNKESFL